jgi:hypothetical protein
MKTLVLLLALSSASALAAPVTYSVPVPARLRPYASFEIPGAVYARGQDGLLRLDFDLPEELVGSKTVHIALTETGTTATGITLEGPEATALCTAAAGSASSCRIEYKIHRPYKLSVFFALLKKYALSKLLPRIQVAERFASDPVGIITF